MKKYLIVLMILFILMGVFSMDILGRSITDIQRRMVGQTNYRINVVKGVVATININGTYGCYIAGESVVYPNIPTFSRNPKLQIGDQVTIEFINGCRETPVILAPEDIRERPDITLPSAIHYALIVYPPNEVRLYDMNGNLKKQLAVTGWSYAEGCVAVDSEGNIYIKEWDNIKKYDSNLNLLFTKNIDDPAFYFIGINMGADGYLYTLENNTPITDIKKRDTSDLSIISTITLTAMWSYDGPICLDPDGNIYVFQDPYVEKWSNAGILLARIDVGAMSNEYAGCAVCGSNVYFVKDTNEIHYAPLDLSSYSTWNLPINIAYCLTVADNHLIISGWGTGGVSATRKYDSDRNLIWEEFLGGATYGYKAGGYNF